MTHRSIARNGRALTLLVSLAAGFAGACVAGTSDDDADFRAAKDDDVEDADAIDEVEDAEAPADDGEPTDDFLADLELDLAEREAATREIYAACVGIQPARAELDAWMGSGLDMEAVSTAICGGELPHPSADERRTTIEVAFDECLGRVATEEDIANWNADDLGLAETWIGICESEESLRRLIRAAYERHTLRPVTEIEEDGWIDTGLVRVTLVREIAVSTDAARIDVVRDAFETCLKRAPELEESLAWIDQPIGDDDLRIGICGSDAARPLIVDAAFRECVHRVPDASEVSAWVDAPIEGPELRGAVCQPDAAKLRDAIAASYQKCLGRKADEKEIDGWVASGKKAEDIDRDICSSEEARRHQIAKAYLACLGRPGSPAEIAEWSKQNLTTTEIRHAICHSPEARRQAIRLAYKQCLRRDASEAEIDSWDGTALSAWEIRWAICHSEEAKKLAPLPVSHTQDIPPGWFYDIFRSNCHTAANAGVLASPSNTGIVACRPNETGMGPRGNGVGGHTFNYVLEDGKTKYYNWGPPPCVCDGPPPADYSQPGCHQKCVKDACGGQFDATTKALPVGQLVEVPGPSICAAQTFAKKGGLGDCNTCCDDRANTNWAGGTDDPHDALREGYRHECKQFCSSFYK